MATRKPFSGFLLAAFVLAAFLLVPATPSSASSHSDTQFYAAYEANNGGTTIFLKMCGSGAKYRFRTQTIDTNQVLWDQTYNNSTNGCLGFWYRALLGGQPGHQFKFYSMYLDHDVSEAVFLDRARLDICTIQSANAVSCSRQIRTSPEMYVDHPTPGMSVQGNLEVRGWAVDRTALTNSGVSEVQIFLDNQYVGNAQYGEARQDVANYLSDNRFVNSGFRFTFNTANYSNGTKTLRVSSKSSVADTWQHSEQQITINNGSPPPANIDPNTPAQVGPTNNSSHSGSSITLSWQDTGDPDNKPRTFRDYEVEIWKQDNSWRKTLPWQVPTSVNVSLPSSGTYSWRVRSGDGIGASPWSPTWNFTIQVPSAPASRILDVPYVDQVYVQQNGIPVGGGYYLWNDCGPASVAMLLSYEKIEKRDVFNDRKPTIELRVVKQADGRANWQYIVNTLHAKGLQVTLKNTISFDEIKRSIDNNHPIVMGVEGRDHLVTVIGYEGTDTVVINDPFGGKAWWSDGKQTNAFINGRYVSFSNTPQTKGKQVKYRFGSEIRSRYAVIVTGTAAIAPSTTANIATTGGSLNAAGFQASFPQLAALQIEVASSNYKVTHFPKLQESNKLVDRPSPLVVFSLEATDSSGKTVSQFPSQFTMSINLDTSTMEAFQYTTGSSIIINEKGLGDNPEIPSRQGQTISLLAWDANKKAWKVIASQYNPQSGILTAKSNSFTEYAVVVSSNQYIFLPLVKR
jgi:hypothetical protein